jgi:ELWxxDGT repeat protein
MLFSRIKSYITFGSWILFNGALLNALMISPVRSQINEFSDPDKLINVNGIVYFTAFNPATGTELWKSDGTTAGTVLVKDINPGLKGSAPQDLTSINGIIYFRAFNPATGYELWRSNGTEAGTVLVKDIAP